MINVISAIFKEELFPADLLLLSCYIERLIGSRDDVEDIWRVAADVYEWNKKDFVDMLRRMEGNGI